MRAPVPKYHLVKTLLLARLEREYAKGDRLPAAIELAANFGVSRITVEQALGMLQDEGVIRRRQGSGSFYEGVPYSRAAAPLSGLLETVFRQRSGAHTTVLHAGWVNAPARIAALLGVAPGSQVAEFRRVGVIDGAPIMLLAMWLTARPGKLVLDHVAEVQRSASVKAYLKKRRLKFGPTRQLISATLADPTFAAELGVEIGVPVLQADRLYHDERRKPLFYSEALYRSDRYRFEVTMKE